MHLAINVEELGEEWVDIVRNCCPNLADANWRVRRGDMVITARFDARCAQCEDRRAVEIIVGAELVETYLGASMMQRTYATSRLVECVLMSRLYKSPQSADDDVDCSEVRALTHADLGMAAGPG